jgi:hypothetical protein
MARSAPTNPRLPAHSLPQAGAGFEASAKSAQTIRQRLRRPGVEQPDHRHRRLLRARRERPRRGGAADKCNEFTSPQRAPLLELRPAHYHAVAQERSCASQQKLRADVADGSSASRRCALDACGMSAMPPIPTELMRHNKTSLSANKRLMRCSNLTDHSISSSARMSRVGGTSMPSVFPVFMFITSSMRDDCSTGRSAALAPLRICPT